MLPRKLSYFCTLILLFICAIKDCASQEALGRFQDLPVNCYDCTGSDCVDSFPGRINKCTGDVTQSCATVFGTQGTVVARGCSGAVANLCNETTSNNCYYCQSSGCNIATVETDYIDCIDCDTQRDVNCLYNVSQVTSTRKCLKSCITALYARSRTSSNPAYELARTCLDDYDIDERELCEAGNLENCVPCTTASCNTVNVPSTPRKRCFICEGENCEDPEQLECPSYRAADQCFIQFDEINDISRMGCLSSLDDDYVMENKRRLYTCNEDFCNMYTPMEHTCAACNSSIDKNCVTKSVGTAKCNVFPFTQCATFVEADGSTVRDCVSNVVDDELFDKCLSEDNSECQICNENSCNNVVFPADRQSCLQCDATKDVNCDTGAVEYAGFCTIYKQGDICVTSVENGLTRRGCQSDFTCNVNDTKSCRTCDTKDCNTLNLVQNDVGAPGKWQDLPLSCYQCTGTECTSPQLNETTCTGNNLQTCMTVFDANNVISMRGCSDAVEAQYTEFCESNADNCFKCKSNNCNDATAITQYIDCYFCDSDISQNCAVDFNGGRTRKCKESCMVSLFPTSLYANSTSYETSRSCLDDLEKTAQNSCSNENKSTCSSCTTSLCNVETLPANRLECLKCVDDKCQTTSSSKCGTYMDMDQCYALFENNTLINLGCRSDLVADTVELLIRQKELWVCDGNNCNQESNFPKPQSCLVCNSANDPLCATNPSALTTIETCDNTPYTECVTHITNTGTTVRDCISSLEEDAFYGCQTGDYQLCEKCVGDNCNALNVYPADRLDCQQCNSATDANCTASPNSLAICPVYDANDKCVSTIEDTYTVRGCASSIKCADENNRASCRICDTPGCNTVNLEKNFAQGSPGRWQELPLSCYSCNSSTECNNLSTLIECTVDINQQCMTVFDQSGVVIQRGCSDTVLNQQTAYCEENIDNCLACNSNSCNIAKTMADYVECLYCDTDRNGNCVHDVENIKTTRKCYQQCMTALYARANETDPAYGLSRSCLDDLEEADREACLNGQKDNCKACSGSKCNTIALPETRLSCLQCVDENCDEPKAQMCAQYRDNDTCYIQFDETNSIVRLGCRSDFANAEADYLLSQKRLLYCDGENCNDLEIVPVSQTCVLCNSRTEANCASDPSKVTGSTSCAVVPYTDCYTRILDDGATERGCLSSLLDNEFSECLTGSTDTCIACKGASCNKKLFPTERLSCHICDSSTNSVCENKPNSLSVCPIYDPAQTCVSSIKNGMTVRGCSAEIDCDTGDYSVCETCSGDGCNTVNVAREDDNNYGKWQDLPLTCWECSGSECSSTTISENKCTLNNLQDCVTVFDASNKVVRRGCNDDVNVDYKTWCDENPEKCFNCKSNKCNSAQAISEFVSCVYCDSDNDISCLSNPETLNNSRNCQGGCMTALYPVTVSKVPTYATIRTCLNDKETADQSTCSAGRDELCNACKTENCNVNPLPANRLSCYQCNGENCDEPVTDACPLYRSTDQCFTLFDEFNSVTEMGCISSYSNLELEELIALKRFYICEGENCNSMENIPDPQQCIECDSSVDPNCAINAYEVASLKTCTSLPYTSCYTSLSEDGFTLRGCVSDLEENNFKNCVLNQNGTCQVCNGDGCNREIFPEDRLQCYTCDSTQDPNCDSKPTKTEICSIFTTQTTCVTALLGTNVTVRGCSGDVLCDNNDRTTCRSCSETGCNSIQLKDKQDDNYHGIWQELPLKCYSCKGEQCLNSLGVSSECTGNDKQDCMTVFETNGNVSRRGCSDHVEDYEDLYCRENPAYCFKCKSNDCNVAWKVTDYIECLFCDSASDPECAEHPENVIFANRSCYKSCMVAAKGQNIIRSCLDDKEIFDQNACSSNNNKKCESCNSSNCNDFVFPRKTLSCHVCSDSSCTKSVSQECTGDVENEFCFATYENNKPVLLGCSNTQDINDLSELASENKLYSCGENDCNALSKLPKAISCIHCNSTADCAQYPGQVTEMSTCNPLIGQCYSLITEAGKTVRGCISDLDTDIEYQCVKEGTCETCESNKCNNKIYPEDRRRCFICQSANDTNCSSQLTIAHSKVCPIYEANDSCVTRLVNGMIERGCGSEMDCDTNDLASCIMCGIDNCNTVQLEETNNNNNDGNNSASLAGFNLLNIVLAFGIILVLNKY